MVVEGLDVPVGVTIDTVNNKLYWNEGDISYGRIFRSDLNGQSIQMLYESGVRPSGIAVLYDNSEIVNVEESTYTMKDIRIFPNPVKNQISIQVPTLDQARIQLTILDIEGKVVKTKSLVNNSSEIEVEDLTSGVYILLFDDGKERVGRKIMKK